MNKYPFLHTLDDVFASLRYHCRATITVVVVVSLFVTALCLNSQFGITMYLYTLWQASMMDGSRMATALKKLQELGLSSERIRTYYFPQESTSDFNGYIANKQEQVFAFQNVSKSTPSK